MCLNNHFVINTVFRYVPDLITYPFIVTFVSVLVEFLAKNSQNVTTLPKIYRRQGKTSAYN